MSTATATRNNGGLGYDFLGELKKVQTPLLRYAHHLTGNEAARDDLVQDTLVRAWAARHRFAAGTSFKAWLFRIARNSFLSGLRRRKRHVELADDDIARLLVVPASQEAPLHLADLSRVIAQLPPAQAEALLALNGAQDGYKAVAENLGIPTGTLRSRVHRARAAIMHLMEHPQQEGQASSERRSEAAAETQIAEVRKDTYAAWKLSGSRIIG